MTTRSDFDLERARLISEIAEVRYFLPSPSLSHFPFSLADSDRKCTEPRQMCIISEPIEPKH